MTIAVVLAAGDGRRLRPFTEEHPKPMLPLPNGATPLGVMVATLRSLSVQKIVIARKDPRVLIQGCEVVEVIGSGNMVHSLMAARSLVLKSRDDVIVCYSDLVVERRLLASLLANVPAGSRCSVCVDRKWESYYRWRFDGLVGDAESLRIDDGLITEIGSPLKESDPPPDAQYIGLVHFSRDSFRIMSSLWDELGDPHLYMTDVLRQLMLRDVALEAVSVLGGWLELDTIADYLGVIRVLDGRDSVPFFDPGGVAWDK